MHGRWSLHARCPDTIVRTWNSESFTEMLASLLPRVIFEVVIHSMACMFFIFMLYCMCALTLLVGCREGHPACKKTEWWGAGMVICLERGADLHITQLMPLPLTVSCFCKIQIAFTFLVPAYPCSPGQRVVKWVCVYACVKAESRHLKHSCLLFSSARIYRRKME